MDKATGITRPIKGKKEWVELWVGDVIKCRVYITDRAGCYLWMEQAEVFWEKDYGQYSIKAKYHTDGKDVDGIFALREVLRRNVEFITKVSRDTKVVDVNLDRSNTMSNADTSVKKALSLSGDRFANVVENVKLGESLKHVLSYAEDIANNDDGDVEAQNCVKVLKSIQASTDELIGDAIE